MFLLKSKYFTVGFARLCFFKCCHTIEGSLRIDPITRWKQGKGMTFFDESRKLRFGVLPRDNPTLDKVVWVTTDSTGHAWHTISAWDNEDGVIIAKKIKGGLISVFFFTLYI